MRKYILAIVVAISYANISAQPVWERKNGPYGGFITDMAFDDFTKFTYAVANNSLFYSTDHGATWIQVAMPGGGGNVQVVDVEVDPAIGVFAISYERLYKSIDGFTFSLVNPSSPFQEGMKLKIHKGTTPHTYLVMGRDNGASRGVLWKSINDGVTWTKGTGLMGTNFPADMAVNSGGSVFVLQFGGVRIERSNDFGGSWTQVANVPNGIIDSDIYSITTNADRSLVYCVGNDGMYETTNGNTWTDYKTDIPDGYIGSGSQSFSFLRFTDSDVYFIDNANHKLYQRSGVSWTLVDTGFISASGFSDIEVNDMILDEFNHMYFGTNGVGVFKSTNGGTVLTEINQGIEGYYFNRMVIADNGNVVVAGNGLFLSTDDGQSWARKNIAGSVYAGYSVFKATTGTPKKILTFGGGTGARSDDNGVNWNPIATPPGYNFSTYDGTNIYAFDNDNVYFSSNMGTSWSAGMLPSGMPVDYQFERMAVAPNNTVFVKIYDNASSSRKLYKITLNNYTTPTVATGTQISIGTTLITSLEDVGFMDGKVYIFGNGSSNRRLAISADEGANWTTKIAADAFSMDLDRDNKYVLLMGNNGNSLFRVNISKDDGDTYEQSLITLDNKNYFANMVIGSNNFGYALFSYAGLYKTQNIVVTPPAPINLIQVGRGSTGLTLRFTDNSLNETRFVVQREISGIFVSLDSMGSNFQTGQRRYFRDRNLTPGTTYNYRVAAINQAGASPFVPISVTTLAESTPNIPDNRSWTGVTANIDGLAAPGTNLTIGIKHLGSGKYSVQDVAAGVLTAITSDNPVPGFFFEKSGQTYFEPDEDYPVLEQQNGTWNGTNQIQVFWRLDKDQGPGPGYPDKFEKITFTLNAVDPIPGPPTNARAYIYSNNSIEVSWLGSFYETQYIVERATAIGGPYAAVGSPIAYPATRFIDDNSLAPGTNYFYRVKASNAAGTSAPSANTTGTLFNAPQFVLTNSEISNNSAGMGTGFTWGDFDNDGDEDAILTQLTFFNGVPSTPYAFRNNGDGTFSTVTSGMESSNYITSVAADYDNDGKLDMFMLTTSEENLLYKGNGNMTFTKITPNPVGENSTDFEAAALTAGWVDYDKNGLLDLFVGKQQGSNLLFSQTAPGTFTKVTTEELASYSGQTSNHAWGDYDNDGDMDIFVTDNSLATSLNRLYKNNSDGTFTRVTGLIFDNVAELDLNAFSSAWADYDNDGDLDLFIGCQEDNPNVLYRNNGSAASFTFTKVTTTPVTEVKPNDVSTFGSAWGDIDNDGNIDLLVNNVGENVIYKNNGSGGFTKIINEKYNDASSADFGVSLADYDKDGFLDIATAMLNPLLFQEEGGGTFAGVNSQLYKNNNTPGASKNWLQVKLIGTVSNRSAIGSRITVTAGPKTMIREISTPSGFAAGNSLIAHFGLGAATTASVTVRWPSGVIQTIASQAANNIITLTEDATGPVVTARIPVNGALFASTAGPVSIELNEASTAVAGHFLRIYLASNPATPVHSIAVSAATKTVLTPGPGDRYSFTLPSKLLTNTDYTISIDAGSFEDALGNDFVALTGWTFHTGNGPVVTTLAPANSSTNIAVTAPLEITFDKNITAVAGKKIKVMNGVATVLDLAVSTNGTIATNKYTLPAPSGNWPFNGTLSVTVDPGAFVDIDLNDFAGITAGGWGFVTVDVPDTQAPVFGTFDPAPFNTLEKNFSQFNMGVSVTDNKQIAAVVMKHRKINQKDFTSSPMTLNAVNSKYETAVTFTGFSDDMGFEYYFEATDNAGTPNTTRLPAGITYFKTKISHTGSNAPTFQIAAGGTKQTWQVISIPFILTNNQISTVFAQLGEVDNTKWRLIQYTETPTPDWLEYPTSFTTIERGKGYFVNSRTAATINLANASVADNTRDDLFTINLVKGWNQVGNPYNVSINWNDVIAYNNAATNIGALKMYVSGTYGNGNTLQPFQGGFVFLQNAATGVKIPFQGQSTPGGGRKGFEDLGNDINQEEWALPLTLTSGDIKYELGSVGMALDAETGFDQYDDITPPRFFEYLEMNFSHPEHFAKYFTRDVVRSQSAYTWEFTADSNLDGATAISWDNSPFSGSVKDLYLLDISRQKLVNMKESNSYSFNPKESVNFRVYFGENLRIAPDKVHLGKAYPNPTSGTTLMAFSLPESGGMSQHVTLDVVDAMGRTMGTISQGSFNPGYHEVSWNAKELNNGFYTYRLTVQGKQGRTIQVNKLIIK